MNHKNFLSHLYFIRTFIYFALILFALASCTSDSTTDSTRTITENPLEVFEQEAERLRTKYKIPGMSVAILRNQETIFADGFGYADIENNIPALADTPYNIASLSKP